MAVIDTATSSTSATPADVYELLRQQLLGELQRRPEIDPADPTAVEGVVRSLVDRHQAQARSGLGVAFLASPEVMVERLVRGVRFGVLTRFLGEDPITDEVMIQGGDVSWYDPAGRLQTLDEPTTEVELRSIVDRLLAGSGVALDEANPMVQAQVLDGRARVGVVIPPIADQLDVTIRFYREARAELSTLVRNGTLCDEAANLLAACMYAPTGVLVVGEPGGGKTTLVNAMLRAAPETLHVRCCEDVPELQVGHLVGGRWKTRRPGPDGTGGVGLRELVRMALGMRPDLIVVGEVRGAEAYELTRAGNAGCGLLATIHANSAALGLQALVSTAIMAGANVPEPTVRRIFAQTIDLVVFVAKEPTHTIDAARGRRRAVMEIAAVAGTTAEGSEFVVEPIFRRDGFNGPLRRLEGAPLPEGLKGRLDRSLPAGVRVQQLLDGSAVLL